MNFAFIATLTLSSVALSLGAHAATQDSAPRPKPPTSVVPAPRSDQWAIERQNELLRRARESAPARVVFVGDSITQSWEGPGKAAWDAHIAPLGALNLGNSGDRTENVLWRLSQAPLTRLSPKHVVLLIGTNNLGHGTSNAEETLQGIQSVADMLAEQCPDATIHILEIFPRGERFNAMRGDICQINQAMRIYATSENATATAAGKRAPFAVHAIGDAFLQPDGTISKETMPDFLHLSPAAYEAWAVAVAKAVKQAEAPVAR